MKPRIDPERLSAFVDGELAPDDMAIVEAHLAMSPEDRAAVGRLRELNARLGAAYDAPHRAPLPPLLLRAVASSRPRHRRWWAATALTVAASILAVAMFLELRPPEPSAGITGGQIDPGSGLHALLDAEPSGSTATLDGGAATLLSSFLDGAGRPCREIEVIDAAKSLTQAIACRNDGSWTIEFAMSAAHAPVESRDHFVPASGAAGAAFNAALDALDVGPVLSPAEEENLIESGWRMP